MASSEAISTRNWQKNVSPSSGNPGKCDAEGPGTYQLMKGDGVNWVGDRHNMFDNYVCGSGHCIGATNTELFGPDQSSAGNPRSRGVGGIYPTPIAGGFHRTGFHVAIMAVQQRQQRCRLLASL